jgi:sugar phosphate isomerase/epimerase
MKTNPPAPLTLLANLTVTLAALLTGSHLLSAPAEAAAPEQKNIGLQMYSLRADIGKDAAHLDAIITAIGRMGYKYVETASYAHGKIYGLTPAEFKTRLQAAGLTALSCHTGRRLAPVVAETKWEEVWAWWDECIATHQAAGMQYIITPSMPRTLPLADLQAYCDYYNRVGERCKRAGLRFGYHNHAYEFETKYDGVTMYEYMLRHTDPDLVCFELDVYWAVMGRHSPVELFKRHPGRFPVLHVKDERELGESGMVGFEAIFRNLGVAGTRHLIVEVEKYSHPPLESVRMSLDYLNAAPFVKGDYATP